MRRALLAALLASVIATPLVDRARAQSAAPAAATTPASKVPANLSQLMKGTLYPESNVVFSAQDTNPADVPRAKDPNMATDLLTTVYGKWEAVENSALAIVDVANLLELPGRKCSNGLDVPLQVKLRLGSARDDGGWQVQVSAGLTARNPRPESPIPPTVQ